MNGTVEHDNSAGSSVILRKSTKMKAYVKKT